MIRTTILALIITLASAMACADGDLVIKVLGVNSDQGRVRIALYDGEKHFKKEKRAITVREALAVTGEPVVFRILDLPPGTYAVHAFHDRNSDGELNHMVGLFPREGYGFSVNDDLAAEENFTNSQFVHAGDGDTEVAVQMRYCGNRPDKGLGKTLSCWIALSP